VRKGVLTSLNSDDAELMRHLDKEAAKTVKYGGLTETEALSLITINPAKQLMIDNKVGSLEVGKVADVLLYDGHPLSNFSKVTKVWIDGHQYFDLDKDVEGRPAKESEKKALITKAAAEQRANGGGRGGLNNAAGAAATPQGVPQQ
jgi:adenine deaminase